MTRDRQINWRKAELQQSSAVLHSKYSKNYLQLFNLHLTRAMVPKSWQLRGRRWNWGICLEVLLNASVDVSLSKGMWSWQLLLDWWFWVTDVIDTTCTKPEWAPRVDIHPWPPGSTLAGRGTCPAFVKECNEAIFPDWAQSASFEIGRFAPSLVLWLINLHHTDWFNRLTRTEIHTVSWSQLEQLWAAKIGQERKNPMSPPHWTSQITTVKPVFRMLSLGWISLPSLHDWPTDGRQCYSSRILGMTEFGHSFCAHSLNHDTKIGITETMNELCQQKLINPKKYWVR